MHNKEWSLKKKIFVGIIVTVVIFAVIIGVIYFAVWSNRGSVMVVPVSDVLTYDYSDNDYGIEGYVSAGNTQNVMKDAGKVSKIYVSVGDYVKKGDPLVQFETKTEDLALKQAEIDLESQKLNLSRAQTKLEMLNAATAYVPPADEADEDTTDTTEDSTEDSTEETPVIVNYTGEALFQISNGEVLTESELRKAKNETSAAIASAQTEIKACQEKIDEAKKALTKCKAVAQFDGYVTKIHTEDETTENSEESEETEDTEDTSGEMVTDANEDKILLQLCSKDGLFIKSYMNEWRKEQLKEGDTVYVMDWRSGEVYEAALDTVSDQPSESVTNRYNSWTGDSSTYYPFTARITDENAALSSGDAVDVYFQNPQGMYSDEPTVSEDGRLNVQKAFIRVENGRKYVYVRGENGLLTKRYIKTDGQIQSGYIVTEGLSLDDYIAFPYGKDVRNGAKVYEGSINELYGY